MPRTALAVLAVLAMLATMGCGGTSTRALVAGPFRLESEAAFFDRAVEAARSHGYEIIESDAVRGRFTVHAHTSGPRNLPAEFVVQCYRPGWIQFTVAGSFVRVVHEEMRLPGGLYDEYRDFSLAVMAALRRDT